MNDIFISYAREDESRIAVLVHALQSRGLSVFWDRQIPPGLTWREHIGNALTQARCVIVAWSSHSIDSQFVSEEADDGKRRGILLPVLLDAVMPPLGFRSLQAADLCDLRSEALPAGFELLVDRIESVLEKARSGLATPGSAAKLVPRTGAHASLWRQPRALVIATTLVIGMALAYWLSTRSARLAPTAASALPTLPERAAGIRAGNAVSAPAPTELLSANALYREFQNNPVDASAKYVDQIVALQGRRGEMVLLSDGVGAAVHIADGGRSSALILSFPDRKLLTGLDRDAVFRFKCTVTKYELGTVWTEGCSIQSGPGPAASRQSAERPTIVGGLLSANALYRAFESNEDDASAKYVGQAMVLEGLRGNMIRRSDGVSAVVHISDRFKSDALILSFPDRAQLAGIETGAKFRFRCTIKKFEYVIVWMENCSVVSR